MKYSVMSRLILLLSLLSFSEAWSSTSPEPSSAAVTVSEAIAPEVISPEAASPQIPSVESLSQDPETIPPEAPQLSLEDQRIHYNLAKTAMERRNWTEFERHYAMLGDYPLLPYLDYLKLKEELNKLEYGNYDRFFSNYSGSFLEARLRQQLLFHVGLKREWSTFERYYVAESASTTLQCFDLYRRHVGGDSSALDQVSPIWITGKSLPKHCDALFKVWKDEGKLTSEVAWQRFSAAMESGNVSLARYVRSFMQGRHKRYAELMLHVHAYPYSVRKQGDFLEQSLEMQQVIAHGIQRYARSAPEDALKQWELYEAQQLFPTEISTPVKIELAKRLTFRGKTDLAEGLIKGSREIQQSELIEQQIRYALESENWEKVLSWLDTLSDDKQRSDRWLYWRARAQAELGILQGSFGHFVDIYAELASKRSFYGFLAADKLGTEYALQAAPEDVNPNTLVMVANLPAMRRARELWLTGNQEEAQAEWAFAIRQMDNQELLAAGSLARQWGWYNGSINAMITGNLWDHLSLRFPLAYKDEILRAASATQLDPNFIYAVARQESAFLEKARSSAGAKGLMQLMPATAVQTAQIVGVAHSDQDLYNAEHNLQLGSHYLNQLLEKYDGNRILATAAYNAGPHRVNKWLKDRANISFDVWIETIPFSETRGYVQNVLSFSVIYAYRLGKPGILVTEKEAN